MNCDQCDMAEATGREPDCEMCGASDVTLETAMIVLADMRGGLVAIDKRLATIHEEIRQSVYGAKLAVAEERRAEFRKTIANLEAKVRELALEAYVQTGSKKPAPGIGIRAYRRVKYDVAQMVGWCKAHAPAFVVESVDDKAISKVAETLLQQGAPVTITEEPSVTIVTDLDKALAGR